MKPPNVLSSASVVTNMAEAVVGFTTHSDICLNVALPPDLDLTDPLDGDALRQIYLNAISEMNVDPDLRSEVSTFSTVLPNGHEGMPNGVLHQRIREGEFMALHRHDVSVDLFEQSQTQSAGGDADVNTESDTKYWPDSKVKQLVSLYDDYKSDFANNTIRKKEVWKKVARQLNISGGTQFSADEVDRKWRKLKERYKKIKDSNATTGQSRKRWVHMDLVEGVLQKDPTVVPPVLVTAGSRFLVREDRSSTTSSAPTTTSSATTTSATTTSATTSSATTTSATTTSATTTSATTTPATTSATTSAAAASPETSPSASRKRKRKPPVWMEEYMKKTSREMEKIRKSMEEMVQEEKRRNDILQILIDKIVK